MLKNRYVRTTLLSRVLLQLGIWVRNFAILLYVTDLTHNDPKSVSLISIAEYAPIFIFAMIGGTFADRWKPKRTMVGCDLLSAASVFAVLGALALGSWYFLLAGTFVSAVMSQFSQPSALKLYKGHVPPELLQRVMALSQSLMGIFMVIGPVIGAFVYQQYGIQVSLIVTGIAFFGSALVLMSLPRDTENPNVNEAPDFAKELIAGLRYVWNSGALRTLGIVFSVSGLAAGLVQPLAVFIVMERLGLDKAFLQWLLMASGAAMLVGGGVIMAAARKVRPQTLLALGLLVSSLTTLGIGWSTSIAFTFVLQIINGLFYPCVHIGIQTLLMKHTEGAFIGRVGGAITPVFMGMMVIGMSLAGYLKDAFSLLPVYAVSAALLLLGTLFLLPLLQAGRRAASKTASS
ncbi:hypothetical protein PAESOLCIP111_03450 [Paenibacillus solanacearum]|uniref:Major facilitator superfamily (MFS) profile domain-containing protein n=1 Tax=Paenibacillus solanacearum TaxID=2048548 RepID=A0A916NJU9_9BACL|nr:MFS transporter [Paenibacillus solanacearum]CAG7633144.1 hypothetical protein PAESOLCIP111_03450 [Paenibacillus solanacearum]